MAKPTSIEQFLTRDLWVLDPASLNRVQRVGVQVLRLIVAAATEFRHRLLDARAAGLVYTTLLSLVPFLAVTFSVLKAFGVHQMIEPVLGQALQPLGEKGAEITTQVIGFVNNVKVGVLGVVGIAGLIYTTYSLIDKVEGTFNAIWRVRQGRSWGRKFTDYLSVILVGPILVMTAFGLLASVQSNALVQHVLEISRGAIERQRVAARFEPAAPAPVVLGDPVQLQQVLVNLVTNALEAMAAVSDGPRRLTIRTALDGDEAVVSVADSGPGLMPGEASQIFDSFYTTKPDGIGVGLAISRSIVEAHGGTLWVAPAPGLGAEIAFRLPAAPAVPGRHHASAAAAIGTKY